jgi:hypothetical protein
MKRCALPVGQLKSSEVEELAELEQYLNERLAGQPDCPKKRALDEDLAFFMNVLKKKKNGAEDA